MPSEPNPGYPVELLFIMLTFVVMLAILLIRYEI